MPEYKAYLPLPGGPDMPFFGPGLTTAERVCYITVREGYDRGGHRCPGRRIGYIGDDPIWEFHRYFY